MEGDIAQLQRLPVRMRLRPGKVGPVRGEGELTQLVKRTWALSSVGSAPTAESSGVRRNSSVRE